MPLFFRPTISGATIWSAEALTGVHELRLMRVPVTVGDTRPYYQLTPYQFLNSKFRTYV